MEWEIEVRVEQGYCRGCRGVGKEVRHQSHDVCVGSDIIVTKDGDHMIVVCLDHVMIKEGDHMIVVCLDHVMTKQKSKLVPKCREK